MMKSFSAAILLLVAAAVSAYQPPLSRRGWLSKAAVAAGVTTAIAPANVNAKELSITPLPTLYAELIDLKALVGEGLQGNPVKRVVENSLVPLQNAMDKNPNNNDASRTNALEMKGHMVELSQAMEEVDGAGYASYVSKGKTYNGGKV